jgi:hypothetical protein
MSKKTILLAATLLLGLPALAQAQTMPRKMPQDQPGASEYAPGQRAKSSVTGQSANEFAPGQKAKSSVTGESARSFAPGQQAKEPHSTGTLHRKR